MEENRSALYSHYIIDGVRQDETPDSILKECMHTAAAKSPQDYTDIVDESIDPSPNTFPFKECDIQKYLSLTTAAGYDGDEVRMPYSGTFTKLKAAASIIGTLWRDGHFKLGDLSVSAEWEWNTDSTGNMAAFYSSACEAGKYLYGLGILLSGYSFRRCQGKCSVRFRATLSSASQQSTENDAEDALFDEFPFGSRHPWMSDKMLCNSEISKNCSDWIIYIPFDTCRFRLGGSLLAHRASHDGGTPPEICDPDYFMDCYEVVRELVEDGVVTAGATVTDGGLITALAKMCGDNGFKIDLDGIRFAYKDDDPVRILFGEIPGVIIQIKDVDYDYVDSQLLLQDIAYYPIGHPDAGAKGITVDKGRKSGVAGILESLIRSSTIEGED